MSAPVVECVPNFSEGRRPEIIEAIVEAICNVPGIALLDRHSDVDHNRTVLTLAGCPMAVEEAAFRAIQRAAELINLEEHTGTHPRLGAADVVPFIPIAGVTMENCVHIARRVGQRVGDELGIPVYLYGEAAVRPDRRNLEDIRRGQYQRLKEEIEINPNRRPDYGPTRLGPAGATIIGARQPLIAYNVYLATEDVSIAKAIARKIRASSGGLAGVKALGMLVGGLAQVSMNLTDFQRTSVFEVMEAIRKESAAFNIGVHHAELVGLIPQEAVYDAAVRALQLTDFSPRRILEERLRPLTNPDRETFLQALASDQAAPAGGAAAAYAAAMGAALVGKAARSALRNSRSVAAEAQMQEILNQTERLQKSLLEDLEKDTMAVEAMIIAFRQPKRTSAEEAARATAIDKATLQTIIVPLAIAQKALQVLALAERCAALGNPNTLADVATAANLARAAITSSIGIVRVNLTLLRQKEDAEPLLAQLSELEAQAGRWEAEFQQTFQNRGGY